MRHMTKDQLCKFALLTFAHSQYCSCTSTEQETKCAQRLSSPYTCVRSDRIALITCFLNNARDDSQLKAFCPWRGSADAASTHAADRDSSSSTLKMPHRSLLEAMAAITVLKSCRQSHQDQLPALAKQRVLSLHCICAMYQQYTGLGSGRHLLCSVS